MSNLAKAALVGAVSQETTTGTTYTYTNGYGQMTKAGVQVQRGATATAEVDIDMKLVTNHETQSWFNEHKQVFTQSQQETVQGHLDSSNTASGWNAIFAWGAKSASSENYFQNATADHEETATDSQKEVVESASKLQSSNVKVTGKVSIRGVSMLPTQAFVFAQISTIQFKDGTSMQVINQSDPVAASASGDPSGAEADGDQKLHIVGTD
jgi:hypothetical protein